jgi:hypothetical protein
MRGSSQTQEEAIVDFRFRYNMGQAPNQTLGDLGPKLWLGNNLDKSQLS